MNIMISALQTPWKIENQIVRWLCYPWMRLLMAANGIPWGQGWSFFGIPIIQKHRQSKMSFGAYFSLRSLPRSNPLGPNHAVIISTIQASAVLEIGDHFGMSGGSICVAERVKIGNNVAVGANTTIVDTDFHPINAQVRQLRPQDGKSAPIFVEDNVFIGMNCLILKGVTIGQNSVIGAGSVVTKNVPANTIFAGNPAAFIRELK